MKRPYFKEEQKMDRNFLVLLLVSGGIVMTLVLTVMLTSPDSEKGENILVLLFLVLVYGLIFWLMNAMKMHTQVIQDGIQMKYPPFKRSWKLFKFSEIDTLEVKQGTLLKDFGGWGYGKGIGKKKSYTAQGNYGVMMHMKDGKLIFLGTQKPKLLQRALHQAMNYGEGA